MQHADVLSSAMYPGVFKDWMVFEKIYGLMGDLPTHAFLHPMEIGDELNFAVDKGRRFFLRLSGIGPVDPSSGARIVSFEVNGERWFIRTTDETSVMVAGGSSGAASQDASVKP